MSRILGIPLQSFRNARLFTILFVRNFWRVCSQFWLSVRNFVWGPFNRNSRGNPSFLLVGRGGGSRGTKIVNKNFVNKLAFPNLTGPLNRLNAILSLLHPLDRYRTFSAIGSAIGRPLSRPISHPNTVVGVLNRLVLNRLGGLNRAIVGAIVSQTPLKQARNKNAIAATILNRILDRD